MQRDARKTEHDPRRGADEHGEKADQQVEQETLQQQWRPFQQELGDAGLRRRQLDLGDRDRSGEYRKQHHAETRVEYHAAGTVEGWRCRTQPERQHHCKRAGIARAHCPNPGTRRRCSSHCMIWLITPTIAMYETSSTIIISGTLTCSDQICAAM